MWTANGRLPSTGSSRNLPCAPLFPSSSLTLSPSPHDRVTYVINLVVANSLLTLEIEDSDSNERWTGEFTSQYIEEITLKAGNFKKFSTFVKMVCSGFGKENESVFMDILTAGDLELLKARKAGKAPNSQSAVSSGGGGKRYVILTYSGEFDRVHYPLPLSFEAAPNPESLQRCVARLRRRLTEGFEQQGGLDEANSGAGAEKDLRQIIANLRQENTQLRHRLRQVESRSRGASAGGSAAQGSAAQAGVISEITGQNAKLKRQVEALRKELSDATALHERQRLESLKELNKWKLRVGAAARDRLEFYSREAGKSPSPAPTGRDGGSAGGGGGGEEALRRRVMSLEQQLRAVRRPSPSGPGSAPASANRDRPWNDRPYIPPVGTAARNRSATPPPLPLAHGPRSSAGSGAGSTAASWSPSALARRPPVARGSPAVPPRGPRRPTPVSARSSSAPSSASGAGAGRPRSASPSLSAGQHRISSSVGGRFDPTLYQQQRAERLASRDGSRPFSAGGRRRQQQDDSPASSSAARRYRSSRESGYSSADSASNSRRSASAPGSVGSKAATSKSPKAGRRRKGKAAGRGQQPPSDSEDDGAAAAPRPKRTSAGTAAGAGARRGIAERSLIDSPLSDAPKHQPASAPASAVPKPFPTGVAGAGDAPRPSSTNNAPHSPARPSSSSSGVRPPPSPSSLAKARPAPASTARTSGGKDGAALSSSQSSLRSSFSVSPRSSLDKALASSASGRGSPLRASASASASAGKGERGKGDEEISEIDRRIQALQSYLDNAR